MRFTLTQCIIGDKIGSHTFNIVVQISLSLLSFHKKYKKSITSSDLLTILSQGKIQCAAFAGVMKKCCLVVTD